MNICLTKAHLLGSDEQKGWTSALTLYKKHVLFILLTKDNYRCGPISNFFILSTANLYHWFCSWMLDLNLYRSKGYVFVPEYWSWNFLHRSTEQIPHLLNNQRHSAQLQQRFFFLFETENKPLSFTISCLPQFFRHYNFCDVILTALAPERRQWFLGLIIWHCKSKHLLIRFWCKWLELQLP